MLNMGSNRRKIATCIFLHISRKSLLVDVGYGNQYFLDSEHPHSLEAQ
jgi:hypothetical protein